MAKLLTPYNLDMIITSAELKAIETGKLTGQKLGIPYRVIKNLHEHERETAPFFKTAEEFQETVTTLFARPTDLVFGEETGQEARDRFSQAIESTLTTYPQENIAIVTHGTVLSLFTSQFIGQDTVSFWQSLGMPAIIAFSHPEMKLLAQMNEIF